MADNATKCYCKRCNQTMSVKNFYRSNNLEKYPNDGIMDLCKACLTSHVDNWDPETFMWILQELDVPYVPKEWQKLRARYCVDGAKVTGTTVLGRYLSAMKLNQYKKSRWKDTARLQDEDAAIIRESMERQGYEQADIEDAIQKQKFDLPTGELRQPDLPIQAPQPDETFGLPQDDTNDFLDDLTPEDRTYLRLKWGKTYRPEEWVRLEQLYEEMMGSYDIQGAGHIDTLKLVCKTSLKANQLLDVGDVDGAQKMIKMYDGLMKSGKFTAAQNKAENGEYVNSIGELVILCEKEGFIPRYYTDGPKDKVDRTLQDLQNYTRDLVTEETNLTSLVEKALRQIEKDKANEAIINTDADDYENDDESFEEALFNETKPTTLNDADFLEFVDFETNLEELDEDFLFGFREE